MTIHSFKKLEEFLEQYKDELKNPVADYGGTDEIGGKAVKELLKKYGDRLDDYIQIDYDSGDDLLKPIKGKYGLGICMDLLEHVSNPFMVAKNIGDSLKKNALLFVTAPFVWEGHNYPKDYWRFTPEGLVALFKDLTMIGAYVSRDECKGESIPRMRSIAVFRK